MTRPVPSIAVVVDTSGSMGDDELDQALTEISAIIATVVPGDSVRVLSVDTDIHTDQHIYNTNQIHLEGAGGTNMATGIAVAAENKPDAIVVITDGFTPWGPHKAPRRPMRHRRPHRRLLHRPGPRLDPSHLHERTLRCMRPNRDTKT